MASVVMAPFRQKENTPEYSSDIPRKPEERAAFFENALVEEDLYLPEPGAAKEGLRRWRISPEPFWLTNEELKFFSQLGDHLLAFTKAVNVLYFDSVKGRRPSWISSYFEQGKPEAVIEIGRMNRFKQLLPGVIRPDIIPSDSGMTITELDSIPGGIGLTGILEELYAECGFTVAGRPFGMVEGFARMMRGISGKPSPVVAIAISEESRDYRPEMRWLAKSLIRFQVNAIVVEPGEMELREEGIFLSTSTNSIGSGKTRVDVIYRFFELFDLKNIPKAELILYAAKKGLVGLTPPPKVHLEEKLAFALFHHPVLRDYWEKQLSDECLAQLDALIPKTWILDPQIMPAYGVIPGLSILGRPVQHWAELGSLGQKERTYVVKPSGFSELAWGSRGVFVGHDLSEKDWADNLSGAIQSFNRTPHVLQEFRKGKRYSMQYWDRNENTIRTMHGRVRLSPYYYVVDGVATLGGILASFVPLDKKLIHGMTDAVMAPCAVHDGLPHP